MREITFISGKGGTGKTSIVGAFASLAKKTVFCDLDVDAANLHLILNPEMIEKTKFCAGKKPIIDEGKCTSCGKCSDNCNFDAIKIQGKAVIKDSMCEGCGVCALVCPVNAISLKDNYCGDWFVSNTSFGTLVHAKMKAGEENSGKLVTELRNKAKQIAKEKQLDFILTDGSPGTGCPVISSITGTNLAVIVVEPTLSGIHDGKRAVELCQHFSIEAVVIINKADMNLENTVLIEKLFSEMSVPVIGKIPVSKVFVDAMLLKKTVVECEDAFLKSEISKIWNNIIERIK